MKPPRVIDIPQPLHTMIRRKFDRARWPEERIGEVGGAMLNAISDKAQAIEGRMWTMIRSNLPKEIAEAPPGRLKFDYVTGVVHVMDEKGDRTGQSASLPEFVCDEANDLTREVDSIREAASLVGIACMGISEEAERAMREIYTLVQKHIPEVSVGPWQIDIRRMVMTEVPSEGEVKETVGKIQQLQE